MGRTATINIRTDPATKIDAEQLFAEFGITLSDAINIFLRKSIMEGGLPFEVRQPRYNRATESAIQEARALLDGERPAKTYPSAGALFAELDAESDEDAC